MMDFDFDSFDRARCEDRESAGEIYESHCSIQPFMQIFTKIPLRFLRSLRSFSLVNHSLYLGPVARLLFLGDAVQIDGERSRPPVLTRIPHTEVLLKTGYATFV